MADPVIHYTFDTDGTNSGTSGSTDDTSGTISTTNKFIGKTPTDGSSNNSLNLLYPTTIINLGFKDSFYSEVTFDPSSNGYILDNINPTSYSDTSDLVNLFVISRIIDEGFL